MRDLTQHVAVITGASSPRGIGWATALALADSGIAVAVADIEAAGIQELAARIRDAGGRAMAVAADVSQRAEVDALYDRVSRELGPPDILVANAGITQSIGFSDISEADWDRMITINLKSVYYCCRYARAGPLPGT